MIINIAKLIRDYSKNTYSDYEMDVQLINADKISIVRCTEYEISIGCAENDSEEIRFKGGKEESNYKNTIFNVLKNLLVDHGFIDVGEVFGLKKEQIRYSWHRDPDEEVEDYAKKINDGMLINRKCIEFVNTSDERQNSFDIKVSGYDYVHRYLFKSKFDRDKAMNRFVECIGVVELKGLPEPRKRIKKLKKETIADLDDLSIGDVENVTCFTSLRRVVYKNIGMSTACEGLTLLRCTSPMRCR